MPKLAGFKTKPWRSKRLVNWSKYFSTPQVGDLYDWEIVKLLDGAEIQWETDPRSHYDPNMLYESLGLFSGYGKNPKHDEHYRMGVGMAFSSFAKPKDEDYLQPLPLTLETVEMITEGLHNKSAGLTREGARKGDVMPEALRRAEVVLNGDKLPKPCQAGKRTQENEKTRLVWNVPYEMIIIESLIAEPVQERLMSSRTPWAAGLDNNQKASRLTSAQRRNRWQYSLDMSKFDAYISKELIKKAFSIIRTWFDPSGFEIGYGFSTSKIFDVVEQYFINCPILMPDLNVYYGKHHGVPSGSRFTQLVDSIVNCIVAGAISSKFNLHINKDDVFILGDDLVFMCKRYISPDHISKYVWENLGIKVHGDEKSVVNRTSQPVHFLGFEWYDGKGKADYQKTVNHMVNKEKYSPYSRDPVRRRNQIRNKVRSYSTLNPQLFLELSEAWAKALGFETLPSGGLSIIEQLLTTDEPVDVTVLAGYEQYRRTYIDKDFHQSDYVTEVAIH